MDYDTWLLREPDSGPFATPDEYRAVTKLFDALAPVRNPMKDLPHGIRGLLADLVEAVDTWLDEAEDAGVPHGHDDPEEEP